MGARRSPVVRPSSHHPSCHARTPRRLHVSANSCRLAAVRRGMAPSEWLTRYVQSSTVGNCARQEASGSADNDAPPQIVAVGILVIVEAAGPHDDQVAGLATLP